MIFFLPYITQGKPEEYKDSNFKEVVIINNSRMNTNMPFNNADIMTEIWKYINIDNMKTVSVVSKDFNTSYKSMSDIDHITKMYNESTSLGSFILLVGKKVTKKHRYYSSNFLPVLASFMDKIMIERNKPVIDDEVYLIYYWIVILIHTVNNSYSNIVKTMNSINYTKKKANSIKIVSLFLKIFTKKNEKLYGSTYSINKLKLMRYISLVHLIMFSKNQYKEQEKFQAEVLKKQNEVIEYTKKEFQISPGRWKYPKSFINQIMNLLKK